MLCKIFIKFKEIYFFGIAAFVPINLDCFLWKEHPNFSFFTNVFIPALADVIICSKKMNNTDKVIVVALVFLIRINSILIRHVTIEKWNWLVVLCNNKVINGWYICGDRLIVNLLELWLWWINLVKSKFLLKQHELFYWICC